MEPQDSLCGVARSFPNFIAVMLQRENALSRGRFCEETFTDLLTAMLIPFAGKRLQILYPDEPHTGGDIDFVFDNRETGRRLVVRVQAKRLNQEFEGNLSSKPAAGNAKSGRANDFERRRYKEILHYVAKSNDYQYRILTRADDAIPLYAFYNHHDVVLEGARRQMSPAISGVNLALADRLKPSLDVELKGLKTKPQKRHGFKRMVHLQEWFFGLDVLFCPGDDGELVPAPELVADRLQAQWAMTSDLADAPSYERLSQFRDVGDGSIIDYSPGEDGIIVTSGVARPTVRLQSGIARPEEVVPVSNPDETSNAPAEGGPMSTVPLPRTAEWSKYDIIDGTPVRRRED